MISFQTTLGRVDPTEGRTVDGVATTTLFAEQTAGTAMVRAFSGGATSEIVSVQIVPAMPPAP